MGGEIRILIPNEDRDSVWRAVSERQPAFTRAHDITDNWHAVREIVLGGSLGWSGAHARFFPSPGAYVMDIGANVGIYSALCAIYGANVFAYEPNAVACSLLREMTHFTGLPIRIEEKAVVGNKGLRRYLGTDVPLGAVEHTLNGSVEGIGSPQSEDDFNANGRFVAGIDLNEAVGETVWDCVKVDSEGAEFEMFLSATPDTLSRIKFCYVEFHPWVNDYVYRETMRLLESSFIFEGVGNDTLGRWQAAYLTKKGA